MDKKPEKLVPEIRFKGFTDDWEQHKFDNVVKRINDKDDNPRLPHIEFENIISGNGTLNKNIKDLNSKKIGTKFQKEDILFGKLRPYLKNWYFAKENGIAVGDFWVLRAKKISVFVYYLIQTEKFYSIANLSSGSKMPRSDWNLVSNSRFNFPENTIESIKIGNLILQLDKLITLQQRKLKQLKQLKKAMLQIIANNRFLFHTKKVDMIKVRVADIYKITRGNVLARSEISNVQTSKYPYPVYSSQTKNHGLMGYYKDFLFKNAITWTTDGANAGTVKYRKGRFYSTNVNGVLLSSEGLANQLTAELLNLVAFKYVSHVGNPKLMNNTMGEIIFNIPKNVENQQYFSDCIESVINLIDKQEKATDKLNKLKKYLLQKLFI